MSLENRIKAINRAYIQRSLITGGSRQIGSGISGGASMVIKDIIPSKKLGKAVGGARPSKNLTPEEKKERARLASEKFRNKKKGNLVSNEEIEPSNSEGEEENNISLEIGEVPEGKKTTKQIYKNKHNKRVEVIQTIDVKTLDDKPHKYSKTINEGSGRPKTSKWIDYVKAFSTKNNVSYKDALRNPKCKEGYRKIK